MRRPEPTGDLNPEIGLFFHRLLFEIGGGDPAGAKLLAVHETLVEMDAALVGVLVLVEDVSLAEHSRVLLLTKFGHHLLLHGFLEVGILGVGRQVVHALGILRHVVHLFFRPFPEGPCPEIWGCSVSPQVENLRLGRAAVAVQIARFRIAGRPATGLEIAQVEEVALEDPANRIAPVVGAAYVMALFADQNMVPVRTDDVACRCAEDLREAPTLDRVHAGLFAIHSRQFQEGGGRNR